MTDDITGANRPSDTEVPHGTTIRSLSRQSLKDAKKPLSWPAFMSERQRRENLKECRFIPRCVSAFWDAGD